METNCPNCDQYTDLPEVLDTSSVPFCGNCGCLIYGFNDQYLTCQKCQTIFLACYSSTCPCCGTFNRLGGSNGGSNGFHGAEKQNGGVHASHLHNYVLKSSENVMDFSYEVVSTSSRLHEVAVEIAKYETIAIDTETSGLDPFDDAIVLLQIATPEKVYIFDCSLVDITPLKEILEQPRVLKILQNAKFDYKFLKQKVGISITNIFDTMLAERLLTAGISYKYSLESMTKKYFSFELDKSLRLSFVNGITHLTPEQIRYAARDVVILFLLYEVQKKGLAKEQLSSVAQLEFDAVVPIAEMELAGLRIDVENWNAIVQEHEALSDQLERETLNLLGIDTKITGLFTDIEVAQFNLNSQKQVIDQFAKLGIKIQDTSEATLKTVAHPAAQKLLEYREHDKVVVSFGKKFLELIHKATNRIHPDFQQYGADTGRLSCQSPNVQQIPAEFRKCFVPESGYKMITCDYSQAELRILAQLSGDKAFCKAFRSGGDLHSITASQMFRIPVTSVTKVQRNQAKVINFGLAYGRGPAALALQIGVEEEEARKLINKYFKAYSGVASWLEKAAGEAVEFGYSVTPSGRKRFYEVPPPDDPEYRQKIGSIQRQGKNTPIQGANADMTKYALVFIYEALKEFDARLVNTVHDEIVVEARADQAEEVKKIVEKEMIRAAELIVTNVPILADAILADTWSK